MNRQQCCHRFVPWLSEPGSQSRSVFATPLRAVPNGWLVSEQTTRQSHLALLHGYSTHSARMDDKQLHLEFSVLLLLLVLVLVGVVPVGVVVSWRKGVCWQGVLPLDH